MPELLDICFSFLFRTTHKGTDGKHSVVLRISFRGQRSDLFTGLYCAKKDWDRVGQKVSKTDKEWKTKKTL